MDSLLTLCHASLFIIERPIFGKDNRRKGYGFGLYCTDL